MLAQATPEGDELPAQVLLVEDEVMIRALLAEELRSVGLAVIEAANADEAWDYLTAGGKADLLFSDVTMPGSMDGVELAQRVKAGYPEMKIIVTSGNPGPRNVAEYGKFLAKPYGMARAAEVALHSLGL
jgi:CheY-like chemotaxis protein